MACLTFTRDLVSPVSVRLLTLQSPVCGNIEPGDGVKCFDLDRTSKEEETDAEDDILFVPMCK